MHHEKHVQFDVSGETLYGICHGSAQQYSSQGVVFLHGWGTSRTGPSSLLLKMARAFAQNGIPSLRFDFRGRGYSQGDFKQTTLLEMIDDVGPALECFKKEMGVEHIVVCGLCSGGEVALGAAAHYSAIEGALLLSTPLLGRQSLESSSLQRRKSTQKQLKIYLHKLFSLQTYRKLFTGKLQFCIIHDIILGTKTQVKSAPNELSLLKAFCNSSKPALFIYGSADPDTADSVAAYKEHLAAKKKVTFTYVEGANHNFYSRNWHDNVIATSLAWLNEA